MRIDHDVVQGYGHVCKCAKVCTAGARPLTSSIEWVGVGETDPDEFPSPDLLDL
jgi:hypothetical protein